MEPYITILTESLVEKSRVLDKIEAADRRETEILSDELPDLAAFDRNMEEKRELINSLDKLDDGFEETYAKVRDELDTNREAHREEILRLQELIREITEKTIRIGAMESRNREAVQKKFRKRRQEIGGKRTALKAANMYSDNMRRINKIDSFFVDKKSQ